MCLKAVFSSNRAQIGQISTNKRMKRISPSLRQKKRYLVFEIVSNKKISNFEAVSSAIWQNSIAFLGELGMAKAGILILKERFNTNLQKGIIKVHNKYVDHLKSALLMVERIGDQKVILKSVGVSGILKKAEKKFMS